MFLFSLLVSKRVFCIASASLDKATFKFLLAANNLFCASVRSLVDFAVLAVAPFKPLRNSLNFFRLSIEENDFATFSEACMFFKRSFVESLTSFLNCCISFIASFNPGTSIFSAIPDS